MKKHILIIGGTSGVGLLLAKHYISEGHTVCITGRKDPQVDGVNFVVFDMGENTEKLIDDIDRVLSEFPVVNTLIYSAGFYQEGHIDALSDEDISTMMNVGLLAPMLLVKRLKNNNELPLKVMLITSSSGYTPRERESVYTATKAGLTMFGRSIVLDQGIGKVLIAAPSGIATPFWTGTDKDMSGMLDPQWVADQIVELSGGVFKYKYAKLVKDPARVEIEECHDNDGNSLL